MRMLFLCLLGLCLITSKCFGQSSEHKIGISVGGGPLDYKSNLGNSFKISSPGWHGAGDFFVGALVNKSFDIAFAGCIGDLGSTRLKSFGLLLKYKAADDNLLPETSLLKPYAYAGVSFSNLADRVIVKPLYDANYMSINMGLGVRYYIFSRVSLGYNLSFGYFIVNNADTKQHNNPSEVYIHNALLLGVDVL